MTAAPGRSVLECFGVTGLSAATISLNWTQINGALTAGLIAANTVFVCVKIYKLLKARRKSEQE
jgi:hypothetical protein